MLEHLALRDVMWLLVEGGPALHAAFFAARAVDRVQRVVTTRVLQDGVPWLAAGVPDGVGQAPARVTPLGADLLVEYDVHRTH